MTVAAVNYEREVFRLEEGNYEEQVNGLTRLRDALLSEISPETELSIERNPEYPSLVVTFNEPCAPDIADLIVTLETLAFEKGEELGIW